MTRNNDIRETYSLFREMQKQSKNNLKYHAFSFISSMSLRSACLGKCNV